MISYGGQREGSDCAKEVMLVQRQETERVDKYSHHCPFNCARILMTGFTDK